MKKIIDYLSSSLYLIYFGFILVFFDIAQRVVYNLFGSKAHLKVVNLLNFCIVHGWYLTGSSIRFSQKESLPVGKTLIFVANHQSMFDIPGIIWFLRKHTPLFVSKIELAKGIPSISYNLRKGGAALIDRKDKQQAVKEISKLGSHICSNGYSAVIFPEGTRSRTGKLKNFATGGIGILLKECPDAMIVPVVVKNLALFNPKGVFPLRSFTALSWTTLRIIDPKGLTVDQVVSMAKDQIAQELA